MPTPKECLAFSIARWEGLWQAMPGDPGNYLDGRLIGTMRGVTPAVLRDHLGVPSSQITPEFMKQTVTLDLASEIGEKRFYLGTGLDRLEWGPATDALVDFGWGSGPGQAVKSGERMLGVNNPDYVIDDGTVALWAQAVKSSGWEGLVRRVCQMRQDFYDLICDRNPTLRQFREGWRNRANWMLPDTPWWTHWDGAPIAPIPVPNVTPPRLLSKGCFGPEVGALQEKLRALGYDCPVSGSFDDATDAAVKAFQADQSITVDGWVGRQTMTALGGAQKKPDTPATTPAPEVPSFWDQLGALLRRIF